MLFLRWFYGANLGLEQLNCIYLQEISTPVKSARMHSWVFPLLSLWKCIVHICALAHMHMDINIKKISSAWSEYLSSIVILLFYHEMHMLDLLRYFM